MMRIINLFWKEWVESRWFLGIGLLLFVGIPIASILQYQMRNTGRPYTPETAGTLVLSLGGVFALLLAAGSATRDLRGNVESFWRSRPIGLLSWATVKYLTGLMVILIVTCGATLTELWCFPPERPYYGYQGFPLAVLIGHSFTLILLYSIGFALGCLFRQAVHAALLGLAAGLLVYFLPLLVPALEPLSIYNVLDHQPQLGAQPRPNFGDDSDWMLFYWPGIGWGLNLHRSYVPFILITLCASAAAAGVAGLALRRQWHWKLDQRLMMWSLGGVAVLLLAVTASQVGSNLESPTEYSLVFDDNKHAAGRMITDGDQGVIVMAQLAADYAPVPTAVVLQRFDLTRSPPWIGPAVPIGQVESPRHNYWGASAARMVWNADRPDHVYGLTTEHMQPFSTAGPATLETRPGLWTVNLDADGEPGIVHHLDLSSELPNLGLSHWVLPKMVLHQDTIYVYAYLNDRPGKATLVRIDVSDPNRPALRDVLEVASIYLSSEATSAEGNRRLELLAIPGLGARQRLELTLVLNNASGRLVMHGDVLVNYHDKALSTWRMVSLTEQAAEFAPLGSRPPTPLERLMFRGIADMALRDGLLHVLHGGGLTVFDISDPARPRKAGHYAVPNEQLRTLAIGANGQILVAGEKLHIVSPPSRN